MADSFALDPALFGVGGTSTSISGRIRDIPKELQRQRPLLSDSEGDEEDDEGEDEEEQDDEDDEGDEEDDEGQESDEDGDELGHRGDDAPASSSSQFLLPPLPNHASTSSSFTNGAAIAGSTQTRAARHIVPPHFTGSVPPISRKGKEREVINIPGLPPLSDSIATQLNLSQDDAGLAHHSVGDDGELGRLISAIRDTSSTIGPTTATNRGLLGQEWDRTMEEEQQELEMEDRRGRGAKKTRGRVALADMEPSQEIKYMLGQANMLYAQGNAQKAIEILTEIIRIEPSIKPAWYTLSTIHEELGNIDKSLSLRIVVSHLARSSKEDWKELAIKSKEIGLFEQAVYCYTQAMRAPGGRNDVELVWDRAMLLKETGKIRQAATAFSALLKLQPHDPTVLRELGQLYFELNEINSAIDVYSAAFEHFKKKFPVPKGSLPSAHGVEEDEQNFTVNEIALLSDFLRSQKRYREAAKVVTDGQRWLQGRTKEGITWESFNDDREFDLRRKARSGWEYSPQKWAEEAPVYPLDINLRLRLGLCRLYEGRFDEAKIHFDIVRQTDVADHPEAYGEIADAYFDKKLWTDALDVFYDLSEFDETNVAAVWIKIAQCQQNLGDLDSAAQCYQAVVNSEPNDLDSRLALAKIYEDLNEPEKALELVTEVIDARRAAREAKEAETDSLQSGSEYNDSGNDEEGQGRPAKKRRPRAQKRRASKGASSTVRNRTRVDKAGLTAEERQLREQALQEEFDARYSQLMQVDGIITQRMKEGKPERSDDEDVDASPMQFKDLLSCPNIEDQLIQDWLEHAAFLVDTFRTTQALFPSDGRKRFTGLYRGPRRNRKVDVDAQADDMAARLQAQMVEDEAHTDEPDTNVELEAYRGVTFDDWAKLIVKYAFMLTLVDEREEAREVLQHVLTSSMMRLDENRFRILIFGLAACAMYADDYDGVLADMRRVVAAKKSESEPLRLIYAICDSGLPAVHAFLDTKFQKYLLRQIKYIDSKALASTDAAVDGYDSPVEEAELGETSLSSTNFKPTKINPLFLMMYGHLMACGKAYQSAIVYYLRAYDLCQDDPLICLSLALAYAHRAMQRQADNRHNSLAQAMALLSRYRKLRKSEVEVNYNVARFFHQLGIVDLAVKHYEKVLELTDTAKGTAKTANMQVDSDARKDTDGEDVDLSKEAAYNLSLIYFTRNAPDLARNVVNKYLRL